MILNYQEFYGNPTVQRIDLPFIGEQLHDDDRAGEGEANGDVDRLHGCKTKPEGQQEAK